MNGLKWKNPPKVARVNLTPRRARSPWMDKANRLRERPGRWALVASYSSVQTAMVTASHIRHGRIDLGDGRFDLAIAGSEIYLRYAELDEPAS